MLVTRGRARNVEAPGLLPLLDTLSNGVGAAVLLFLVFTIAAAPAAGPSMAVRNTIMVEILADPRDLLVAWIDAPSESTPDTPPAQPLALFRRLTDRSVADAYEFRRRLGLSSLSGYSFLTEAGRMRAAHLEVTSAQGICWRFRFARVDREHHWARERQLQGVATVSFHGTQNQDIDLRSAVASPPHCVKLNSNGATVSCDCPG